MPPPFSTESDKNTRISVVDVLRGVAVLLVICRHWPINNYLGNLGWLGVDLFFVISGFLISGLLFSEQDKNGDLDLTRFFLRRGLKIYPLFFLLILVTWGVNTLGGLPVSPRPYVHELLFVQNYLGGIYLHTWSLAVEEHFYLLLMLCFLFFGKYRKLFLYILITFLIIPFAIRLWRIHLSDIDNHFLTHTRLDSLFAGVLLQYLWRYKRSSLYIESSAVKYGVFVVCAGYILSFGLIVPETPYVQGIGFSLIALTFAGILWVALNAKMRQNWISRSFSFVGYYSYPIYLLHIPMKWALEYFGMEEQTGAINIGYFGAYTLLCVLAGVAIAEMIEQPILRWRDRKIPSKA